MSSNKTVTHGQIPAAGPLLSRIRRHRAGSTNR